MNSIVNRLGRYFLFCGLALAFTAPVHGVQARGIQVLHSFKGHLSGDGESPWAALTEDSAGNLYGTTLGGGANDLGTVFKVAPDGTETVLYSFCSQTNCSDGYGLYAGLILDKAGNLYGAATNGGVTQGLGTVFKLAPDGIETVLHAFTGGPDDGNNPYGGVILGKRGILYGTTNSGGSYELGTIFELAPNGTEIILHSFAGSQNNDGEGSLGNLTLDKDGNIFGTTALGGDINCRCGTVFRLRPDGYAVLHSFTDSPSDGSSPEAGLIMDKAGNLYGTTIAGGANNFGTVFRLAPDDSFTVLYSFCSQISCSDGDEPTSALVMDKAGNLYGTTSGGGASGSGTVFKLAPNGTETTLHSLSDARDGVQPLGGLILGKHGNLYGTASSGGAYDFGTVFGLKK
ncbi:MAG TPA: choice-of-anchor tandem repeat GloVer-containing protein [Rhizomicrobium sp.]|jgi:uncharacterized repeat protein (TIGR03803 family)